jgi:hypothetical protein
MDAHSKIFIYILSSWRANFFPSGTGTQPKKMCETKGPGHKKNWNSVQMFGRQNLYRQICIRSLRRG